MVASPCATPLGHNSPKKPQSSSAQTHSRSAARRAEGFSELLQFTRLQQTEFGPLGDMDVSQSLPSFVSEQLRQESGGPLYDLTESGTHRTVRESSVDSSGLPDEVVVGASESEEGSVVPQFAISPPLGENDVKKDGEFVEELMNDVPSVEIPGESNVDAHYDDVRDPRDSGQTTKVDTGEISDTVTPQIADEAVEASEARETNISSEPAVLLPEMESKETSFPTSDEVHVAEQTVSGEVSPSIERPADIEVSDQVPCEETVTSEASDSHPSVAEGDLSSQLATSPPLADSDDDEGASTKSGEISSTEKRTEVVDISSQHAEAVAKEESNLVVPQLSDELVIGASEPRENSIHFIPETAKSPPLDDSDEEEGEESTTSSKISSSVDRPEEMELGDHHIHNVLHNHNTSHEYEGMKEVVCEISNSIPTQLNSNQVVGVTSDPVTSEFAVSPPLNDSEDEDDEESLKSRESSLVRESSEESDYIQPAHDAETGISETHDKTELLQNGSHHLRHRTGEQQSEHELSLAESDIALSESRQERESSEERNGDRHTTLSQPPAPMATGVLGWLQRFLRRGLFGGLPPFGFRSGLIVVGVAAISSLVIYNLGQGGSAGGRVTLR